MAANEAKGYASYWSSFCGEGVLVKLIAVRFCGQLRIHRLFAIQ